MECQSDRCDQLHGLSWVSVAVRHLLDALDMASPPCGIANLVMITSRTPVDHFAEDVGVPCMLGGLSDDPDKQGSESGVPPRLGPPRHVRRGV
jgi:hypothetical protein